MEEVEGDVHLKQNKAQKGRGIAAEGVRSEAGCQAGLDRLRPASLRRARPGK